MIWIGARWPSTWSRPACESSSTTKIAESFQYLLCEISSTILPVARSLSATCAAGLAGPPVWSLESQNMFRFDGPFFSKFCFQISYRYMSGTLVSNFGKAGSDTSLSDGIGEDESRVYLDLSPVASMFLASQY